MKRRFFPLAFLVFFVLILSPSAWPSVMSAELEEVLKRVEAGDEISVIVTLSDRVRLEEMGLRMRGLRRGELIKALREKAESTQRPLHAYLEERGIKKRVPLWLINGVALTARKEVIEELSRFPGIGEIRVDGAFTLPPFSPSVSASAEWNLAMIRAPELWAMGYRGQGVVVANMDSGVDKSHPDLESRWRGGSNSWYDPYGEHESPFDSEGHGTRTMGILVGGDAGGNAIGVAPGARWIAVKIFNDHKMAYESAVHQGFQWLLDPDGDPETDDAPHVVSNSWGFEAVNQCFQNFQADIGILRAAGIAVVFSAGNEGPNLSTSVSPANNLDVFAVGAVDPGMNVGGFSSRGPSACDGRIYPDLVAPGVNIRSAVPGGSYGTASGTSFSAPHVAGAMALLLSAFPGLTPVQVEWSLKQTARDLGDPGPDNVYGYGLIDVVAAYEDLASWAVVVRTFYSRKAEDGWVKELVPLSGVGGRKGSSSLIIGSDSKGRRFKSILSFDTSEIPPGATIKSATLRLKRRSQKGWNPFLVQGPCQVDIMEGPFGTAKLEKADFEASAMAVGVGVLTYAAVNGAYSMATLDGEGLEAIRKGGITQMRIYCGVPPREKALNGFVKYYAGAPLTPENSPTLEVIYVP